MSEIANSEGASETEKPVQNDVKFPPFPEPADNDFDEDISEEERTYYKNKFKDLNTVKIFRLHCTACDRHMGCSARNERMRAHPLLRTLVCHSCHTFYNSGEFEKGDDGSELYCRWCGQGGQVYCCSDCPHVFCAKCIKRNLGGPKIKDIENADDWKCFKCNPECLWDLRAICWAVLRYCDLKNKITYLTEDPELKAALQKDCAIDLSECCKHKSNKRHPKLREIESSIKKKDIKKETDAKVAANIISKMPSTIQVKKFASVSADETNKQDKKPQKRPASPKQKSFLVKNPISIAPRFAPKILTPVSGTPPLAKKIRLPNCTINTPIRFPNVQERKPIATYARIRPKVVPQLPIPIANNCFNGFTTNVFQCQTSVNDNINLSLESLTQGLDMSAVVALSNNSTDDDVVCTPDFPLEPLCEVTEDNDDDVECITPGPVAAPKVVNNPPPLIPRTTVNTPDVNSENIIQMTDNDVTVNESTGGLKFRVDPQTLSSNKMYRLPDGRIFAINANPNMPGGYSATIVAVTEANKGIPKGATFAAKLSSVSTSTPASKNNRNQVTRFINSKRSIPKLSQLTKTSNTPTRECDLNVPVEWYRYNLIDAVDSLEYSLSRLNKLKKEATSVHLRTRSVNEMRNLHRTLERLLNTSSTRFNEIRENLNKGLKQYIHKKSGGGTSEEDDDVEILPDMDDDPIFIDENSVESNMNGSENQEVDLTGPGSSEYNDSSENRNDNFSKDNRDSINVAEDRENSSTKLLLISNADLVIENVRDKKKRSNGDKNKINAIEVSKKNIETGSKNGFKDVEHADDMNSVTEETPSSVEARSQKNADKIDLVQTNVNEKADNTVSGDIMAESDDILQTSGNRLEDSDEKKQDLDDSDVKMQEADDIIKNQNFDHATADTDDKMEDSNNKVSTGDKIQSTEEIKKNNGDTKQDDDDDDDDDKMHDSEISEEMIETLLKDDNSRDSATTNSEVPKALQVT